MKRQGRGNGGVERIDAPAGRKSTDRAAGAPYAAPHAVVFVAHDEDGGSTEAEIADSLGGMSVEADDGDTAGCRCCKRAHQ